MQIRSFRHDDAQGLAELFFAAVRELGPRHYSPEQVAVWAPTVPDPNLYDLRANDGRILLVAVDAQDQPAAYGDLAMDGHIDHFYCRPNAAGTGVTAILYGQLEKRARELGITRLYVEASEAARGFFARKGFAELERREFLLRGVQIHNYRMEKQLNQLPTARLP